MQTFFHFSSQASKPASIAQHTTANPSTITNQPSPITYHKLTITHQPSPINYHPSHGKTLSIDMKQRVIRNFFTVVLSFVSLLCHCASLQPLKNMVKYNLWGKNVNLDIPRESFPNEEEIKKMDNCMTNLDHGWFQSRSTDAQLHFRKMLPDTDKPVKGIIVWQHGIMAHSGLAFELQKHGRRKISQALMSETLVNENYALYSLDMLGHGFSEGSRWYVPDWRTNRDDLDDFARFAASQHDRGTPLFLAGESYGGNCVLHVARKWQDYDKSGGEQPPPKGFAGALLVAPAIIGDVPPAIVVFILRYLLRPLRPKWTPFFMPNPVSPDRIWRDPEALAIREDVRYKEILIDGSGKPFSLGTGTNLLGATEAIRKLIPGLSVPFCVCHGTKDEAVKIEGTDYLMDSAATPKADRACLRVDGAYHDLLGDPSAEEVMKFIVEWTNQRVEKHQL